MKLRFWPETTFGRLGVLIATVLLAMCIIVLLALRSFGVGPGGSVYADLVAGNARWARELPASQLPPGILRVAAPPARSVKAFLPTQLLLVERMEKNFGKGTRVLFSDDGIGRVWIRPEGDRHWIGVEVPAFFSQSISAGLRIFGFALLVILLAAWWFARHLTLPLMRLARDSERIAAGDVLEETPGLRAPLEVRQLEASLVRASSEVRRAGRERELLLAGVSHDLRTPLARLRLGLELEQGIAAPERALMIGDVEEMDGIIGQFLDFVRDGRDEEPVSCELTDLLRELALSSLRTGCEWQLDVPVECLCIVRPLALRRALSNLMRNAEVHGRAPWRLSLECDPSGPCIRVRDHGAGLPGEVLARAGQPFLRADSSRSGAGGTGLGLSLVQRVAGAHGGEVRWRNPADGGCEVSLRLWPTDRPSARL